MRNLPFISCVASQVMGSVGYRVSLNFMNVAMFQQSYRASVLKLEGASPSVFRNDQIS